MSGVELCGVEVGWEEVERNLGKEGISGSSCDGL